MLNPNAGKKAQIPINTATGGGASSQTDKMAHQALQSAKSASFSPPPAVSSGRTAGQGRGRRKSTSQKTIMKGVYFEPAAYQALVEMQEKGQNVSKFINRLVRQSLAI